MAMTQASRAEFARRMEAEYDSVRKARGVERAASFTADVPSPRDSFGIEAQARREWEASSALREEFGGRYEAWLAYSRANAKGLVRIISRKA